MGVMATSTRPSQAPLTAAFVLSLLAGIWIVVSAWSGGTMWGPGTMGGWLGGHGMMRGTGVGYAWLAWAWAAGLVILVCAGLLYVNPERSRVWGALILVASVLNLFVGAGGLLAASLGIVGGALALSWRPAA